MVVAGVAGAIDPIVHLGRGSADPGAGVAAEQAGVIAHVVLACVVVTGADHEAQAAVLQRVAGEEVQRTAQRLVRARGDRLASEPPP
ncbi:hypothetical protein G6F24_018381 [Rhizopus arrhizus]|nr:hypothetical protein G6F24_018381 [Rhizopus arrhizus]